MNRRAAVASAWRRVIGRRALAEDRVFGPDADPDLLRPRLVFALEGLLGRSLTLDAFRGARRPSEFIDVLEHIDRPACRPVPDLLLLPGAGGDDIHLLLFRARLAPPIGVAVIEPPEWHGTPGPGSDFDALVEDAVARIIELAPAGDLRLAGFSAGGHVAYAACRRLQARGRTVARLGLIDSSIVPPGVAAPRRLGQRVAGFLAMAREGRAMESVCHFTVGLVRRRWPHLVGPVMSQRMRLPFDFGFHLRRAMVMDVQMERLSPWLGAVNADPTPLDVETVLFRSEEHGAAASDDLGWRRFCRRLRVVDLPGSHTGIFSPGHVAEFRAVFMREMGFTCKLPAA